MQDERKAQSEVELEGTSKMDEMTSSKNKEVSKNPFLTRLIRFCLPINHFTSYEAWGGETMENAITQIRF